MRNPFEIITSHKVQTPKHKEKKQVPGVARLPNRTDVVLPQASDHRRDYNRGFCRRRNVIQVWDGIDNCAGGLWAHKLTHDLGRLAGSCGA